jgi:hypothetical protein
LREEVFLCDSVILDRFAFQACSFNHSDISPCLCNQRFTGDWLSRKPRIVIGIVIDLLMSCDHLRARELGSISAILPEPYCPQALVSSPPVSSIKPREARQSPRRTKSHGGPAGSTRHAGGPLQRFAKPTRAGSAARELRRISRFPAENLPIAFLSRPVPICCLSTRSLHNLLHQRHSESKSL